ncbi:MAG: hypothetical protein K2F56_05290, partial [Anaeroplasmataceae bacterium]|nr:hypothetical protein [Anaeroplasmataceae bacterium]
MNQYVVDETLAKIRLDKALTQIIEGKSRSYTLKCIEEGKILVNGKKEKPSYSLKKGDVVSYDPLEEQPLNMDAKNLNLEIVYEDNDVA